MADFAPEHFPPKPQFANPAVVGLSGFAITTLVLQIHNFDQCNAAPVVALGLVYGGFVQLVAGFLEFVVGNSFACCAFTGYGSFWLTLSTMLLFKQQDIYNITHKELGWFFVGYTVFTAILVVGTLKRNVCETFLFGSLLLGFILLDIHAFVDSDVLKLLASIVLTLDSLIAFYAVGHHVLKDTFKTDVLPLGKPLLP